MLTFKTGQVVKSLKSILGLKNLTGVIVDINEFWVSPYQVQFTDNLGFKYEYWFNENELELITKEG